MILTLVLIRAVCQFIYWLQKSRRLCRERSRGATVEAMLKTQLALWKKEINSAALFHCRLQHLESIRRHRLTSEHHSSYFTAPLGKYHKSAKKHPLANDVKNNLFPYTCLSILSFNRFWWPRGHGSHSLHNDHDTFDFMEEKTKVSVLFFFSTVQQFESMRYTVVFLFITWSERGGSVMFILESQI